MSGIYGTVLLIEDDEVTAELVRSILEEARFEAVLAFDGQTGLERTREKNFDVIILDVDLPGMDGLSLCREVRKVSETSILFLSSKGDDIDKVLGLEVGADDYLSKPFSSRELVARVRALLRRSQRAQIPTAKEVGPALIRTGELVIDEGAREIKVCGQLVHLTSTEFNIMIALVQRPGRVLSRQQLMDIVWGQEWIGDEKTVDVHLRRLRKKIFDVHQHDYFCAVRGSGYKFVVP